MFLENFFLKDPSIKRHFAKTITWRVVGTFDTMLVGWFITGNPLMGVKIGGFEILTKMALYFFHERVWFKINFGLPHRKKNEKEIRKDSLETNK
ncbi:MAG: DUF2061 domain-containing protein [Bacteroidetes bacterium]|nr:DUF2061 domain-containing protein [Bacteroidota bacterium]